jgi:hypothetical protein
VSANRSPQIVEVHLRLHTHRPEASANDQADWDEWSSTSVGDPIVFRAVADPIAGSWNGPLPPGAEIAAPVALDDPWWTVFLPDPTGPPVLADRVGGPLAIGERHVLPAGEPGDWRDGVRFEGAIVIE